MIGAGGAIPPPDGYWPAVERICRERGVLLIADEVISGFGRLGRWFGCERYGFTPDLMTCAKGITSGLRAARRRHRLGSGAGAVLGRGRGAVPAGRHLFGPSGRVRRRARRTWTSSSARISSHESPRSSRCCATCSSPLARDRRRRRDQKRRAGGCGRARRDAARRESGRRGRSDAGSTAPRRAHPRVARRRASDLAAVHGHRGASSQRSWPASQPAFARSLNAESARRPPALRIRLVRRFACGPSSSLLLGAPLLEAALRRRQVIRDLADQAGDICPKLEQLEVEPPLRVAHVLLLLGERHRRAAGGARHERWVRKRRGHRL